MYSPETIPSQPEPQRQLVDMQYEEVAAHRTAILNREFTRLKQEGWHVQIAEDHLVATRRDAGLSQWGRAVVAVVASVVAAFAASVLIVHQLGSLPVSRMELVGAAAGIGLIAAFVTRDQAARDRRVTVSIDGQGRPFVSERDARDL